MTASPRPAPAGAPGPDWNAVRAETVGHLQELIRFNTVNPPGNEMLAARYLERVLAGAGIETHLLEPAPGRAALVARLRGTGDGGAVMLLAHMDVVGVEREHWSVDPFAGVVKDGFVYGRGAIDDKGMLAANLEAMLLLKREVVDLGGTLSRDVLFVANSDEEAGGDWGMGWLIDNHPELVDAEYAINEGGRTRVVGGRPLYMAVQNTEKVSHLVSVTAHGPPGHASVPLAGNAIFRLGRALAAIGEHREPVTLVPSSREFFRQLAAVWPERRVARAMADVVSRDAERVRRGAEVLAAVPVFDAVLRNGISPVLTAGGVRHNVIPTEASATLNVRTLPGKSLDAVIRRLRRVVRDPQVTIEASAREPVDAPASPHDSPMFVAIAEAAREANPALAVVPYMSTGATDSARLRAIGIKAYGILPFPLDEDDEGRMHGHDERVPVDGLVFGTRVIYGAVLRVATPASRGARRGPSTRRRSA